MRRSDSIQYLDFCPALAEMVRSQRVVGRSGKVFDNLGAMSTLNNLVILRRLMLVLKPKRTLEIGLSFGGSALVFGATHRDLGHASIGQHVALDPFQETVWASSGLAAMERAGLSGYLDFRSAFSAFELPKLVERGEQFGLVYVDGSHLFEDVIVDFYFVGRLLTDRGIVAFDDSTDPHVHKLIRFIRANFSSYYEPLDLKPFRPDDGLGWRYSIARALGRNQLTAFRRIRRPERNWDASFHRF